MMGYPHDGDLPKVLAIKVWSPSSSGHLGSRAFIRGSCLENPERGGRGLPGGSQFEGTPSCGPICWVKAVVNTQMSWDYMYRCPVLETSTRGPVYPTARMDTEDTEDK
ncbi:uncharacterized protein METZ01_LOCUS323195, partial [marine metagenome]